MWSEILNDPEPRQIEQRKSEMKFYRAAIYGFRRRFYRLSVWWQLTGNFETLELKSGGGNTLQEISSAYYSSYFEFCQRYEYWDTLDTSQSRLVWWAQYEWEEQEEISWLLR